MTARDMYKNSITTAASCAALAVVSLFTSACKSPLADCAIADGFCNPLRTWVLYNGLREYTTYTKYVLIAEQGTPNGTLHLYSADRTTGALTELSTATLNNGSQTGSTNGRYVYIANNLTPFDFNAFSIENGSLVSLGTKVTSTGGNPSFAVLHPSSRYVYAGFSTSTDIEIFPVNSDGSLGTSSIFNSAATTSVSSMVFDSAGTRAWATDQGGSLVRAYSVAGDGSLTLLGTAATDSAPVHVTLDHEQKYLYVTHFGASTVYIFETENDVPTLAGTSTIASASFRTHLAPYPGNYAYSAAPVGNTLSVSRVDHDTGLLSLDTAITGLNGPIAGRPGAAGRFLYVSDNSSGTVYIYDINQYTGTINLNSSFAIGTTPYEILVIGETVQE